MEGGPGGARLAAVGGQSGEVPGILGPHDGGEVLQPRCPVMPVHRESAEAFIQRGGRIPAPMQALKN